MRHLANTTVNGVPELAVIIIPDLPSARKVIHDRGV